MVIGAGSCYFLRVARAAAASGLARTGRVRPGVVRSCVVVAMRFNPPPGWPPPPDGFAPDPGWRPDPSWPPAPPGWQLWVTDEPERDAASGMTPGYIGYGQPAGPAGYSQWQGWNPPMPLPSTDGMAVAGFVLGLLGFVLITAI